MIKNCLVCGKNFITYQSKILLGRGKYCSKKCCLSVTAIKPGQRLSPETEIKVGSKPWSYRGWRYSISRKSGKKYKLIYNPDHPMSTKSGYIREHRLIAEKVIGRLLLPNEIVHHKNGDTLDNRPSNLEVMDKRDHDRMNISLNIHKRWIERR